MSEIEFPAGGFPVHELANLGPMQEEAVLELMDDIKRYGYNPDFPIRVMNGKLLDGRHRQEACLRLGIEPIVESIRPKGGAAKFVAQVNSLKTYRKITPKERGIYAAENFTDLSPTAACKLLGFQSGQYHNVLKAYKKTRRMRTQPNPWDAYKAGGKLKTLLLACGIEYTTNPNHNPELREQLLTLEDDLVATQQDVDLYKEMVSTRDNEIKELQKRLKALDPQERIVRQAGGDATTEDRLRDRLEFTEDELKKSSKINEKLSDKVRELERMHHTFRDVFSNVDWTGREVTPPEPTDQRGKTRPHEFLALMSDAHYGEVVSPSDSMGLSYNSDIAKRRIEHYRDIIIRFKDLRSPAYDIEKLTVAVLGDMLSGNIHDELRVYNEKNMTEQMRDMTRILNDLAGDFAGEFPEVEFIIIPGNHPRLFKKPEFKKKWDNYEVAMGDAFQLAVEVGPLENVKVTVPQSLVHIHEIYDQRIAMLHGDGIKSNSFAGIPFYGMRNRREGLQSLLSSLDIERADMLLMGHFHQHLYWSAECDVLINGAIKGGDEYSIGTFLSAPEPVQVLLEFHPEHGLAAQEHISLGHIN